MTACPRCDGRGRQVVRWRYTSTQYGPCRLCAGVGLMELGGEQ